LQRRAAPLALAAIPIAAAAIALHLLGRHFWCRCGTVRLWYGNAWGAENSQQLFDPYTFTHITHGVLLYGLTALLRGRASLSSRALLAISLESLWEVTENTDTVINRYREANIALGYYGDSIFNSLGDILACAVGFALAARMPLRATIALIIGLELLLTWWIRDSLLLNLIMLATPIEAIRQWQLGAVP
jgi:hypothetical protein